jgi:2,4-dienoyl-CoA reductase-like NADH-dependent reductase (Old Yellow Enzyme family)/thioredoxin reductase
MPERFPRIFEPLDRGRFQLKNRIVFPGHQTLLSEGGVVGERMLGYYVERAKGGVGAVIVEGAAVHPTTVKFTDYLLAYDERIVPTLDRLADRLHEHDCRAILQLAHSGSRMSSFDSRRELWAPSQVRSAISPEIPHEMTLAQIEELLEGYRVSARHAARSRIDGVEIHAAHEYLLGEFLSPLNNRRTDDYGGSLANRMRLLLRAIEVVRDTVGPDLVVGVRLNGSDLTPGGLELEDYVEIASILSATGSIDYLNVSAGTSADNHRIVPTMDWPQGLYVPFAAAIRAAVDVPVITVGRIKHPEHAEEVLASGQADVVAEARALIADPEWVAKARRAPEQIRPCIGCNQGCFGFLYGNHPISCTVNPAVGLERTIGLGTTPRQRPRSVLVVGGGPAGLEAAIAAAEAGHDVVLCERSDRLGGQVPAAASIPTRAELGEIVEFQCRELLRLGVEVRTSTTVGVDLVDSLAPDVVVVATGSRPRPDPLPGDASVAVWSPIQTMDCEAEVLDPARWGGAGVVVLDGVGHFPAYAPAERLVDAGHVVTVMTAAMSPVANLDQSSQLSTTRRLGAKGVRFVCSTSAVELRGGELVVRDVFSGELRSLAVDLVVAAVGNEVDDTLACRLAADSGGPEVHVIGDALAPRSVLHAVREGRVLGRSIGARNEWRLAPSNNS